MGMTVVAVASTWLEPPVAPKVVQSSFEKSKDRAAEVRLEFDTQEVIFEPIHEIGRFKYLSTLCSDDVAVSITLALSPCPTGQYRSDIGITKLDQ